MSTWQKRVFISLLCIALVIRWRRPRRSTPLKRIGNSHEDCHQCGREDENHSVLLPGTGSIVSLCSWCFGDNETGEEFGCTFGRVTDPHKPLRFKLLDRNVWVINSIHAAGGTYFPGLWIANRMFAVRLDGYLVLISTLTPTHDGKEPFQAIEQLSIATGLGVKYLLCADSSHGLYLSEFARRLPHVQVLYTPRLGAANIDDITQVGTPFCEDIVHELEANGLKVHRWDGLMEPKLFSAGRDPVNFEGMVFLLKSNEMLFQGSHVLFTRAPHMCGWLFSLFLWINSIPDTLFVPIHGLKRPGALAVHDLAQFRRGLAVVRNQSEDMRWRFLVDYHSAPNVVYNAHDHQSSIERALSCFDEEHNINFA